MEIAEIVLMVLLGFIGGTIFGFVLFCIAILSIHMD